MASGARREEDLVAKSAQKVTLSPSQDIPFDKLVLNQSNVRRIKAGISVEERAKDIARRGLLQSLSVRPVLADDGSEAGKFEIPAGGRRFQALSLLVKQKRLVKTTPIPCIVRDPNSTILAEDEMTLEQLTAFTFKGEGTAQLLDNLKKGEMASKAERLLKGSGWLREVLRRHDLAALDGAEGQGAHELVSDAEKAEDVDLPAFLIADL